MINKLGGRRKKIVAMQIISIYSAAHNFYLEVPMLGIAQKNTVDNLINTNPANFFSSNELVTNKIIIYAAEQLKAKPVKIFSINVDLNYRAKHPVDEISTQAFTAIGDLLKTNKNIYVLEISGVNFKFDPSPLNGASTLPGLEYMLKCATSIGRLELKFTAFYAPLAHIMMHYEGDKRYKEVGRLLIKTLERNHFITQVFTDWEKFNDQLYDPAYGTDQDTSTSGQIKQKVHENLTVFKKEVAELASANPASFNRLLKNFSLIYNKISNYLKYQIPDINLTVTCEQALKNLDIYYHENFLNLYEVPENSYLSKLPPEISLMIFQYLKFTDINHSASTNLNIANSTISIISSGNHRMDSVINCNVSTGSRLR